MKLSVSLLVTKLQVFVEDLLKEFRFKLTRSNKPLNTFPIHLRLNSLKIFSAEKSLEKKLSSNSQYDNIKLHELKIIVEHMNGLCNDNTLVDSEFRVNTKFPLGKTGSNEVVSLFKQINGENIFEKISVDSGILDEILWKRHAIIHEDANPQLTEPKIREYINFVLQLSTSFDHYIARFV